MTEWHCPACTSSARTYDAKIPMHPCDGLAGLLAPLIPVGSKGESKRVERQDYIGKEAVQLDAEGKPTMAVVTTRDDGEDCTIFAPCVSMMVRGGEDNGMDE